MRRHTQTTEKGLAALVKQMIRVGQTNRKTEWHYADWTYNNCNYHNKYKALHISKPLQDYSYNYKFITINATKPNIFIADKIDNIIPFGNTKQRM